MANLPHLFEAAFRRHAGRIAFEDSAGATMRYTEVRERAARMAGLLRRLGVRPGDRVAVQAPKTLDTVCLYLATLRTGAVYLPLNTAYRDRELAYFLDDARPALFVGTPDGAQALVARAADEAPQIETISGDGTGTFSMKAALCPPDSAITERADDDLAALLYTSGTTGQSKGAMLSHGNLASNAETLHAFWDWQSEDVLLHALPIFHIHGLFVALHSAFLAGAKVLWLPKFETDAVLDRLPDATVFMGVPTFYTRLLESPRLGRESCRRMRLFIAGSAPLRTDTFHRFKERTGHTILERYGMSEAGMIASNPYVGERRPGTVGFPLPGVTLRIVDAADRELATGAVGSLEIAGPGVFQGYWGKPEQTREAFRGDGFFVTGDLGMRDADGYVSIVGRSKDLVISGGLNVYPKEIEARIDALDGVGESAVIGVPHADYGEAVVGIVVPEQETDCPDSAAIIAALKENLASFKVPKRIVVRAELPRNAMGKVQKNLLRSEYAALFDD